MYNKLANVQCDNKTSQVRAAIPASWYTSESVYSVEKKEIFYKCWNCVGHVSQINEEGDFFTHKICDREIVVVRNRDGELRAFYNTCRHRGHKLVDSGTGNSYRFVCPYHAWTYDLNGQLVRAPESEEVDGFDKSCFRLTSLRLAEMCGLIFVTFDPGAPEFEDIFGHIDAEIRAEEPTVDNYAVVAENPFPHHCNWKVSVENFSECYHCGPVHKYLTTNVIDADSYKIWGDRLVQNHRIDMQKSLEGDGKPQRLWHLFPNTAVGFYPIPSHGRTMCIRHMYPVDKDNTIYHYRWLCDKDRDSTPVIDYCKFHSETTGAEDGQVAAGTQIGLNNGGIENGLLLLNPGVGASTEHAIAYFQDLVRAAIKDELSAEYAE